MKKNVVFKEKYKNTLTKVQITGYPSCPLPAYGEPDPWEVLDNPKKIPKNNQKRLFPIFNPCTTCDNPQRGSTNSGLFGFPADMLSLKKAQK